jgi:imidazolonepropionase-like amidohydrolase
MLSGCDQFGQIEAGHLADLRPVRGHPADNVPMLQYRNRHDTVCGDPAVGSECGKSSPQ